MSTLWVGSRDPGHVEPWGGIQFYSVLINVVAKYHWAGKAQRSAAAQVFATVVDEPCNTKSPLCDNVMKDNLAGTFDIHLLDGVRTVPAEFFNGGPGLTVIMFLRIRRGLSTELHQWRSPRSRTAP